MRHDMQWQNNELTVLNTRARFQPQWHEKCRKPAWHLKLAARVAHLNLPEGRCKLCAVTPAEQPVATTRVTRLSCSFSLWLNSFALF